jgi:hypothetical protein
MCAEDVMSSSDKRGLHIHSQYTFMYVKHINDNNFWNFYVVQYNLINLFRIFLVIRRFR